MDKRKVIAAYYRGELSLQECAQILGLELHPLEQWLEEDELQHRADHEYAPIGNKQVALQHQHDKQDSGNAEPLDSLRRNSIHDQADGTSSTPLHKPTDWWYWH
ncbi:hypothetical protein [Paenibacillus marinisediminis]